MTAQNRVWTIAWNKRTTVEGQRLIDTIIEQREGFFLLEQAAHERADLMNHTVKLRYAEHCAKLVQEHQVAQAAYETDHEKNEFLIANGYAPFIPPKLDRPPVQLTVPSYTEWLNATQAYDWTVVALQPAFSPERSDG